MIVVIDQNHCLQPLPTADWQLQSGKMQSNSHKIEEQVDGEKHSNANFCILLKKRAFQIGQLEWLGIECWAIVIGKHPLDVVMSVLKKLVIFEFRMKGVNAARFVSPIFVEEIILQILPYCLKSFLLVVSWFELFCMQYFGILVAIATDALYEELLLVFFADSLQFLHENVLNWPLKHKEMSIFHELQYFLEKGNLACSNPISYHLRLGVVLDLFYLFFLKSLFAVADSTLFNEFSTPKVSVKWKLYLILPKNFSKRLPFFVLLTVIAVCSFLFDILKQFSVCPCR